MIDLIKRPIGAFVSLVSRLTRVAIARELIEAFTTAYDEAARLEASGKPALARFLRAELEDALGDAPDADPTPRPALNGDSNHYPFALPRPDTSANQPAGEGSQPRRRGRRPRNSAEAAHEAPPQQATEPADQSTTPISNSNHHI